LPPLPYPPDTLILFLSHCFLPLLSTIKLAKYQKQRGAQKDLCSQGQIPSDPADPPGPPPLSTPSVVQPQPDKPQPTELPAAGLPHVVVTSISVETIPLTAAGVDRKGKKAGFFMVDEEEATAGEGGGGSVTGNHSRQASGFADVSDLEGDSNGKGN